MSVPKHPAPIGGNRSFDSRFNYPISRFLLSTFALASVASGQEALRNSLYQQSISESHQLQWDNQPYNIKAGDLRMLIVPSLELDYNDNIYIRHTDTKQDWILRPMVRFDSLYPLTEKNSLNLDVGIGYDKYLLHDARSGLRLDTDSGLSFDFAVSDFQFNLHERFSYTQDPATQSELSNVSSYENFNNTIGASGSWDMGDLVSSLGYDHINSIMSGSSLASRNRTSEMLVGRAGLRLSPKLTTGIEATGDFTSYDTKVLNNNTGYSIGAYADWLPGSYFQASPRAGYSVYMFQETSQSVRTGDLNSWYADLKLSHKVTETISYSIDAGRETRLGIRSDALQSWFVRPSLNWTGIQNLSANVFLTFESNTQGIANRGGNISEKYDLMGTGFYLRYPIMKKLSAGLNYRFTIRSSDTSYRDYSQNLVGLQLSYTL